MTRCLSLLILVLLTSLSSAQESALVAEPGSWDFGRIDQSMVLDQTLIVRNRSNRLVRIKSVKQTCGCIQAQFEAQVLEPGATAELQLKLLGSRGEGQVRKFVLISSSDPVEPVLRIPVNGDIDPVWWPDFQGHVIDFGQVKNGDSVTKTFRVQVKDGFDLKQVDALIHPADGPLSLKTRELVEDGKKSWEFQLTLGGRLETGGFDGMLRIDTDFAPMPFRGYRVVAEIVTSTVITPARLNLGLLAKGAVYSGTIKVEKTLGSGLLLPTIHCEDERVTLEKVVIDAGKHYEVRVTIRPRDDDQELRGEIVLILEEPGQRVVRVRFLGRVAKEP